MMGEIFSCVGERRNTIHGCLWDVPFFQLFAFSCFKFAKIIFSPKERERLGVWTLWTAVSADKESFLKCRNH